MSDNCRPFVLADWLCGVVPKIISIAFNYTTAEGRKRERIDAENVNKNKTNQKVV